MRFYAQLVATAAFALAVLGVAGCGETVIDDVKTEEAIETEPQKSSHKEVKAVECPSVERSRPARPSSAPSLAGGEEETATMKILNKDADIEIADLKARSRVRRMSQTSAAERRPRTRSCSTGSRRSPS